VYEPPRLRLALGLGDQELEQRLRPALDDTDDLLVVAQCLAADQLLQAVESRQVDAAVVAWSLHRLTDTLLEQIERSGPPIVLLVPDPEAERWSARRGPVLPLDAQPLAIRQALQTASRRGERVVSRPRPSSEPVVRTVADSPESRAARVIAVAGGAGSPGRTIVAINLATALGTAAPTVLVEADLCAPAVAAYLDRDPSRNVCTLAHAVRENPHAWDVALVDELQPLNRHCGMGVALCGPPKREMRASIAPTFFERLVGELGQRYRYIVLDVGPELLGMDTAAANHRAALASAQQVLLVTGSDLVGLWHARTMLDQLERQLGMERQQVSLVLNRYDARHHHPRAEVEWHLGAPVVAVIPFDHHAAQRAIAEQRPLMVDPSSRASRALLNLAERLHAGKLRLPDTPAAGDPGASWWRRLVPAGASIRPNNAMPQPRRPRFATNTSRRRQAW
jgi:MinD-like ATPase involved in chromosome partitioning or flagellar assembly